MLARKLLIPVLASLLWFNNVHAAGTIKIENAWSPEAPPVVNVMAGYMIIKNNSNKDIKIKSAKSPLFKKVEIHRTTKKNGMLSMIKQDNLLLKAKKETELKPNGIHMMLMGRLKPVTKGSFIPVTIHFDNGESTNIKLKVKTDREPQMKCGPGKCGSM